MKRINLKDVGIFMLLMLYLSFIALGLISCGARKTDRQLTKEETKTENTSDSAVEHKLESNVKENVITKIDDKNKTVTKETTYSPEDPTKEAYVIEKDGTKTVLNNTKKTYKETIQDNNTKTEINVDSEKKQKEAVKKKIKTKTASSANSVNIHNQTKRDAISWLNFLWLIIPIGIIIWLIRKYREFGSLSFIFGKKSKE